MYSICPLEFFYCFGAKKTDWHWQLRKHKIKDYKNIFISLYSFLFSVPATEPTEARKPTNRLKNGGNGNNITYISSAVVFTLLMAMFVGLGFLCYRRLHQKQQIRWFIVIVASAYMNEKNLLRRSVDGKLDKKVNNTNIKTTSFPGLFPPRKWEKPWERGWLKKNNSKNTKFARVWVRCRQKLKAW